MFAMKMIVLNNNLTWYKIAGHVFEKIMAKIRLLNLEIYCHSKSVGCPWNLFQSVHIFLAKSLNLNCNKFKLNIKTIKKKFGDF